MKELRGQVAVITGAGGGFGQELTRQLLAAGSYLILSDRSPMALARAADLALAGHAPAGRIIGLVAADLADPGGAAALHRSCRTISANVDLLINNAGLGQFGMFATVPPDAWEPLMQVNLLAPMRLTAAFLPGMLARGSGHLVYVASVAGLVGAPGLAPYCAAKFGLRGLAEAVAAEVQGRGIDVTAIYPFFARTPILQSPQFGPPAAQLPAAMLYEPAFVIAALLAGIRRRQLHVYPGTIPRAIDWLRRLAPWALPQLGRWLGGTLP